MRATLRIVLMWMLVLAIPAQGVAAATMLHCRPGHHPAPVSKAVAAEHAAHGHVSRFERADAAEANTVRNHAAADAPSVSAPDNVPDLSKFSKQAQQKCSACASCCSAFALISMPALLPDPDPAKTVVAIAQAWAASVVIDGPERPPRSFLA